MFITIKRVSAIALCFLASWQTSAQGVGAQKIAGQRRANPDTSRRAPPPSPRKLRKIIDLSKQGNWAILGGSWIVVDGRLKDLQLNLFDQLLEPSAYQFFEGRKNLIYAYGEVTAPSGTLAVFDIDTGEYRNVAPLTEQPHDPAPSPDRQYVAYITARERLQVVNLHTQKVTDVAPATWESAPSWSPDGKYIVFEKEWKQGQGWEDDQVAVFSLDSGNVRVLGLGRFPSWSPKGDLIAYTDAYGKQLKVSNPEGGQNRILKENLAGIFGPIEGPLVWSPDQKKLIYNRAYDGIDGTAHGKVYLIDVDTRHTKLLAKDEVILGWQ